MSFGPRSLVSADSPGKAYIFLFPLRITILEITRIPSGMLNFYSEAEVKSARVKELVRQKQQRRPAKFSLPLGTQSSQHQLVQELLSKLPVPKRTFLL